MPSGVRMNCQEFIDQLIDLEEGTLEETAQRLCREHSDVCHECADYLTSYRSTVELGKAAFASPVAQSVVSQADASWDLDEDRALPEESVQAILEAIRPGS